LKTVLKLMINLRYIFKALRQEVKKVQLTKLIETNQNLDDWHEYSLTVRKCTESPGRKCIFTEPIFN